MTAPQKYRTIVADPPWDLMTGPPFASNGRSQSVPYPTMSVDEIKALPVRGLSDNLDCDAHLYLWVPNAYLRDAFDVALSWGFHHSQTLVWCKDTIGTGLGGTWPSNVEFVLFCRRPKVTTRPDVLRITSQLKEAAARQGISALEVDRAMGTKRMAQVWWLSRIEYRCACPTNEQWSRLKAILGLGDSLDDEVARINAVKGTADRMKLARAGSSWFHWPRGEHSAKPEAFLDLVESVSPGPYLELFARRNRLGWDTWGNECLDHGVAL